MRNSREGTNTPAIEFADGCALLFLRAGVPLSSGRARRQAAVCSRPRDGHPQQVDYAARRAHRQPNPKLRPPPAIRWVDALAKRLGVTEEMFRRNERGEVRLRAAQLCTLSDELGVPLKTFFEEARHSRSGNVTYLRRWFNCAHDHDSPPTAIDGCAGQAHL